MSLYSCKIYLENGLVIRRYINASSKHEAENVFYDKYQYVKVKTRKEIAIFSSKASKKDIIIFLESIKNFIVVGYGIASAIEQTKELFLDNKNMLSIVENIKSNLNNGLTFYEAISFCDLITNEIISIIKVGEETGRLTESIEHIIKINNIRENNLNSLKKKLIYPIFTLIISLICVLVICNFCLPLISKLYSDNTKPLPYATKLILDVNDFFFSHFIFLVYLILLTFILHVNSLSLSPKYTLFIDSIKIKTPLIGKTILLKNVLYSMQMCHLCISAGVLTHTSLKLSFNTIDNIFLKKVASSINSDLIKGLSLKKSLYKNAFFPEYVTDTIVSASGKSDVFLEVLSHVVQQVNTDYLKSIDAIMDKINPVITILMGVIVTFVLIATYLPLFSLGDVVN